MVHQASNVAALFTDRCGAEDLQRLPVEILTFPALYIGLAYAECDGLNAHR